MSTKSKEYQPCNITDPKLLNSQIECLIAKMDPDIKMGFQQDNSGLGYVQAEELAKIGKAAIVPLIKALPISSEAHWALGLIGGDEALQNLLAELKTQNWRRMTAAVQALAVLGDKRALKTLNVRLEAAKMMAGFGQSIDADFERALKSTISTLAKK
jgi:HEAT repeat protein